MDLASDANEALSFTFATWNMRQNKGVRAAKAKVDYLRSSGWDVLALQEVTPEASRVIAESDLADHWLCPPASVHGVALAARNGVTLTAPALMGGIPAPERGMWAMARVGSSNVEVGSLHVTNAAGEGKSAIKRTHYVALAEWLAQRPLTPRVLGMDANHTFEAEYPDVPGAVYEPRHDDWAEEYAFFSADATHGLRDAWFDHLQRDLAALSEAHTNAPHRPSATSLEQRYKERLFPKRMDYVFTAGLGVRRVSYEQAARQSGLSDHALVLAALSLPR